MCLHLDLLTQLQLRHSQLIPAQESLLSVAHSTMKLLNSTPSWYVFASDCVHVCCVVCVYNCACVCAYHGCIFHKSSLRSCMCVKVHYNLHLIYKVIVSFQTDKGTRD